MLLIEAQFLHISPILSLKYFFIQLWVDLTLFAIVFSLCMSRSLQALTVFYVTVSNTVSSTYFDFHFGKVVHTILNKRRKPRYISFDSDLTIAFHAFMIVFYTYFDLTSFSSLYLRSLTLQSVLYLALTCFEIWYQSSRTV